eukprot:1154813-Prymnesium_polylepis.1
MRGDTVSRCAHRPSRSDLQSLGDPHDHPPSVCYAVGASVCAVRPPVRSRRSRLRVTQRQLDGLTYTAVTQFVGAT